MPPDPFVPPPNEYEDVEDTSRDANAKDETPDATDPKQLAAIRHTKKFQQQQTEKFWKDVFASPVGRRVMWEMLQSMHAFETKFACGPSGFPQPEATWFHAGEQSSGDRLFKTFMRYDWDGVRLMLGEFHPDFIERKPARSTKPDE